jgi:hypothetical protein
VLSRAAFSSSAVTDSWLHVVFFHEQLDLVVLPGAVGQLAAVCSVVTAAGCSSVVMDSWLQYCCHGQLAPMVLSRAAGSSSLVKGSRLQKCGTGSWLSKVLSGTACSNSVVKVS